MEGGKRKALLVGCNYHDTDSELYGCINDVVSMKKLLLSKFGFKEENIELLTDEPTSPIKPTGANIKSVLKRMVEHAQEGDLLFFHFSGHGTLISSSKPHYKQHEAIVPCDFNLITDVDLRKLVNEIHPKATLTIISDSCNSGGLIDQEKEQIGPSTFPPQPKTESYRPKFIPLESIVDKLKQLTGLDTENIGDHMVQHFKDDASLSFRLNEADQDKIRAIRAAKKGDYGILLSGCQSNEYSQEDDESKPPHGVFSYAVKTVLEKSYGVSNKQVIMSTRVLLHEQGQNRQHPCLYCSDENADATFLLQPTTD